MPYNAIITKPFWALQHVVLWYTGAYLALFLRLSVALYTGSGGFAIPNQLSLLPLTRYLVVTRKFPLRPRAENPSQPLTFSP